MAIKIFQGEKEEKNITNATQMPLNIRRSPDIENHDFEKIEITNRQGRIVFSLSAELVDVFVNDGEPDLTSGVSVDDNSVIVLNTRRDL